LTKSTTVRAQLGAQKRQIARLAEVHFDGGVLVLKINFVHACGFQKTGQPLLLAFLVVRRAEIRKINGSFFTHLIALLDRLCCIFFHIS
jgi:hypothetical protein